MSGPVQAKPANDLFINLVLGVIVAAAAFTGLLRVAGSMAAFLTGLPEPTGGFTAAVGVLATPADPGAAWALMGSARSSIGRSSPCLPGDARHRQGFFVWRAIQPGSVRRSDPHRLAGTATASRGRPSRICESPRQESLDAAPFTDREPAPGDVGYLLGTGKGGQVWATVEDQYFTDWPAPFRQGPPHRDQRDPRRTRSGHHDFHPPRQSHCDVESAGAEAGRWRCSIRSSSHRGCLRGCDGRRCGVVKIH